MQRICYKGRKGTFWLNHFNCTSEESEHGDVLKYPLGPVPYALATVEVSICNTVKATLASALQKSLQ